MVSQDVIEAEIAAYFARPEPEGEGWYSLKQLAAIAHTTRPGITEDQVRSELTKGIQAGKWEKFMVTPKEIYYRMKK